MIPQPSFLRYRSFFPLFRPLVLKLALKGIMVIIKPNILTAGDNIFVWSLVNLLIVKVYQILFSV
jgi:hypothetical protein